MQLFSICVTRFLSNTFCFFISELHGRWRRGWQQQDDPAGVQGLHEQPIVSMQGT